MKAGEMSLLRSLFVVLALLGLPLCGNVGAQEQRYGLTRPIEKNIIFEDVYRFYVMRYDPPITIRPLAITRDQLKKEQLPEKSAKAYFAAMSQGNYEWYESLLSDEMKGQMAKDFPGATKKPQSSISELQNKYRNATIEFTHRVERQTDSIIHYRVLSPKGAILDERDLAINFRGQIINLSGDVVYDNWRFTGATRRIKKTMGSSGTTGGQ